MALAIQDIIRCSLIVRTQSKLYYVTNRTR